MGYVKYGSNKLVWILLGILIVAFLVFSGIIKIEYPFVTVVEKEEEKEEVKPVSGFLQLTVLRTYFNGTKTPLSSATVTIYDLDGNWVAQGTTGTDGSVKFTGTPLTKAGDQWWVKVTYSTTTVAKKITVPSNYYTVSDVNYFVYTLEMAVNPSSVDIYVIKQPATTLSSGGIINITATPQPKIDVKIDNPTDGTGFETWTDPVTGRELEVYAVVKVQWMNSSYAIIMPTFSTWKKLYDVGGGTIYYGFEVDETALAEYYNKDGTKHDGLYYTTEEIDASLITTSGMTVKLTITVYKDFNVEYFMDKGKANTEAISLGTFTFYLKRQ